MAEGCKGGWAIFHGYFAENGHLVTENCMPYQANTDSTNKCRYFEHCNPIARVKKSYMIQDSTEEKNIRKEILRNGMVDANIVIEGYLGSYKKGVLKSIYRSFSSHYKIPGHTIAIIGWGEENGD